ncbi:MAG: hypothetical protein HZC50_10795 [Nitrospirae bacterium]|nr:hypothetical protein [Nitrospirota bacterium]
MQEVFQWEVQLTTGKVASASSMETEEAPLRSKQFEGESPADRRSEPLTTSANATARREASPAVARPVEPVVFDENGVIPIESVAMTTATDESSRATDDRSASVESSTDTSRDETSREVEQDEPTARAQEPSGSEFSAIVTALRDRGGPMSGSWRADV